MERVHKLTHLVGIIIGLSTTTKRVGTPVCACQLPDDHTCTHTTYDEGNAIVGSNRVQQHRHQRLQELHITSADTKPHNTAHHELPCLGTMYSTGAYRGEVFLQDGRKVAKEQKCVPASDRQVASVTHGRATDMCMARKYGLGAGLQRTQSTQRCPASTQPWLGAPLLQSCVAQTFLVRQPPRCNLQRRLHCMAHTSVAHTSEAHSKGEGADNATQPAVLSDRERERERGRESEREREKERERERESNETLPRHAQSMPHTYRARNPNWVSSVSFMNASMTPMVEVKYFLNRLLAAITSDPMADTAIS